MSARVAGRAAVVALAAAAVLIPASPAAAHDDAAILNVTVTEPHPGLVRTVLDVGYELLGTDGARELGDRAFEFAVHGDLAARAADELTPDVVEHYADTVSGYVLPRWTVSTEPDEHGDAGAVCPNRISAPFEMVVIDDEPHVRITIDSDCRDLVGAEPANYRFTTGLFPGAGGPGTTTTVVVYVTAAGTGVAELDTDRAPTMSTNQDWGSRMWEFFVLGGEHLLFGPDHILFLLALIVGSRRLRDLVACATAFTAAHSITFILAALGVVSIPDAVVEPIIAISISFVAVWHLWRVLRRSRDGAALAAPRVERESATMPSGPGGVAVAERVAVAAPAPSVRFGLDGAAWARIAVVFAFGLIHGVGFAGALGIAEPFSWGLLGALVVFNLGIEVVQLGIIAVLFPLVVVLRTRAPVAGHAVGIAVAAIVAVVGLLWFLERVLLGG